MQMSGTGERGGQRRRHIELGLNGPGHQHPHCAGIGQDGTRMKPVILGRAKTTIIATGGVPALEERCSCDASTRHHAEQRPEDSPARFPGSSG
jgi:hypothetical protein